MVDWKTLRSSFFKWFTIQKLDHDGLKTGQHMCFMIKYVQFWNGPPNHVIRQFENQTKNCPKSQMFGFQVLGVQMVTVPESGTIFRFVA